MEHPKRPVRRVRNSQTNIPNKKVKQGTKAGGKVFLISIGIFIFFIILLIFGFFFYLTSNPQAGKGMGIGPSTIKSVTSIFAGLVFGTLFIVFLVMGLSYIYKLTTKTEGKTKNVIGVIVIFILGLVNLTFGYIVYSKISKIKVDEYQNTNSVIIANINYLKKDGTEQYIPMYLNNFPLIAPIKVSFQLNIGMYKNKELSKIIRQNGPIQEVKFQLICGNKSNQIIDYYPNNQYKFPLSKYCLYLTKGKKTIKFRLIYNTNTQKNKKYNFPDKEIYIDTNIKIKSHYKLTDAKDEIILGEKGDEVKFDINKLPEDLKLEQNYLLFDFIGKLNFTKYKGLAKYIYHDDGSYNVILKIPNVDQAPLYYFPVRVLPPTKPICNINYKEKKGVYYFTINGEKVDAPIKKITYKLFNLTDGNTIKLGKGTKYKAILNNGSDYQLEATIMDTKGKKGTCKSNIIYLSNKINYKYDILLNGKKMKDDTNEIIVSKLPGKFNIKVENIEPENDVTVGFDIDNDGSIDEEGTSYSFKILKKENKIINIILEDTYGNKQVRTLNFNVKLSPILVILHVSKDTGEAPFEVKFDASESQVTNDNDKIVYFDWDFDDGEKNTGTRQGIISHTYRKYGTYYPSVTIKTKQGHKINKKIRIDVLKYVNTSRILFPNNLGGQSIVGAPLKILLNTSGPVKEIKWFFGDGNTLSCEGRECTSISHTYEKKGRFKVKAITTYSDGSPDSTAVATIDIIE